MENIVRLITQLGLVSLYPIILVIVFLFLFFKKDYKDTITSNFKALIINTTIATIVGSVLIYIFFSFEDTIYFYDYSGHWIRALNLRELFFSDPSQILKTVYDSMLYHDYSYLPALFGLGFIVFNYSYTFFAITNFVIFVIPSFILLQIIYYKFFKDKKWLPLISFFIFHPLYITVLYGKVDAGGMFFLIALYMILIIPKFNKITLVDNLFSNILAFIIIFFRRWYLYPLVALYLVYFIKYLFYLNRKIFNKEGGIAFFKIISSGALMLITILIWFMPFFLRVVGNNYSEAYEFYNHDGKLFAFIDFISPIIILISLVGIYKLFNSQKRKELIYILISIVLPTLMLWNIQSFEQHHYCMILPGIFMLFMTGMSTLNQKVLYLLSILLLLQSSIIYTGTEKIPLFTNLRKTPEVLPYKQDVINLSSYLTSLMGEGEYAYLASGSNIINDDMIRNALLPDLNAPGIDFAVLDLRDGFPKDLQHIRYVIILDPIQYSDRNYQHIYDVVTHAVVNEPLVSEIYNPIHELKIDDINITIYERIGTFTHEIKQYFYDEMLKYYPDKGDFFSYILD